MPIDPVTGMLIGQGVNAAGGIISGILGMGAQDDANAIAWANWQQQQEANFLQRIMAERQMELATAGTTDARGDRTEYIPGVGWVTRPSDTTRGLISTSDAEQRQRLTGDAQLRRQGLQANASRRGREGLTADAQLDMLNDSMTPEISQQGIIQQLIARATEDTNKAFDRTGNQFATQAVRSGRSNAGDVMQSLNRQRSDAVRSAGSNANLEGMQLFQQLTQGPQNQRSNLYNQMASRASNFEDVPFAPTNVNEGLANRSTQGAGNAMQAMNSIINTSGRTAAMPGSEPDYSKANAWGGAFANIGSNIQDYFSQQQMNDLLKQFANRQLGNA